MDARAFIEAMNAGQASMAMLPPDLLAGINGLIELAGEQLEAISTLLAVNRQLMERIEELEGRA